MASDVGTRGHAEGNAPVGRRTIALGRLAIAIAIANESITALVWSREMRARQRIRENCGSRRFPQGSGQGLILHPDCGSRNQ